MRRQRRARAAAARRRARPRAGPQRRGGGPVRRGPCHRPPPRRAGPAARRRAALVPHGRSAHLGRPAGPGRRDPRGPGDAGAGHGAVGGGGPHLGGGGRGVPPGGGLRDPRARAAAHRPLGGPPRRPRRRRGLRRGGGPGARPGAGSVRRGGRPRRLPGGGGTPRRDAPAGGRPPLELGTPRGRPRRCGRGAGRLDRCPRTRAGDRGGGPDGGLRCRRGPGPGRGGVHPGGRRPAHRRRTGLPVVAFDDALPDALVLAAPAIAARLARHWLGPLLALPADESRALVDTLEAWVRTGGSPTATARALPCHRNTVLNRLRRVQRLTDGRLGEGAPPAELALALAAYRLGVVS
ncbi:helix-turn-helix domain-containing protein [Nocardioides zeae]